MLRLFGERLRITQSFERLKRRLAENTAAFALTMLAVISEVEQADAIRAACIR